MLAVLMKLFPQPSTTFLIVEPLLTTVEREALATFGLQCVHSIQEPKPFDFLYMPHCPAGLYQRELMCRWSQQLLCDTVILGNSFDGYVSVCGGRHGCVFMLIAGCRRCGLTTALLYYPNSTGTLKKLRCLQTARFLVGRIPVCARFH